MAYDLYEFGNKKKNPNKKTLSEIVNRKHKYYIQENVKNDKYIIDYGAGIGRTLSAFNKDQKILGVDISLKYQQEIEEKANKLQLNFKGMHINESELGNLPFKDNEFDAVVCSQVLMHQPPHLIVPIMKELRRIGKKVVVNTVYANGKNADKPKDKEAEYKRHLFRYDFYDISEKYGFEMFNDVKLNNKQMSFCYR